jgi:glyoxylase I family protein
MFKRIDHVEITTDKLEDSIEFYTNVLGFQIKSRQKMSRPPLQEIVYITLGDTMVELLGVETADAKNSAPWQISYRGMAIEVEDMDKAIEYLATKGIEPSVKPMLLGTSKRGEIRDPNGLMIELRQW